MQLCEVEIRDYRSIFVDDAGQPLRFQLGPGMNTLVGQNNCGKSNALRAISLALDPNHPYNESIDTPGPRPFSHPVITLTFQMEDGRPDDADVIDAALAYERALGVPAHRSHAHDGRVVFKVSFVPSSDGVRRHEAVIVPGERTPSTTEHEGLQALVLAKLREAVRFVHISSGESIESVLEGNFREILHSVVRERLHEQFDQAEHARQAYIGGLQDSLLGPLRDRLRVDVAGLFPEIENIALAPSVSSIDRTLSNVGVHLDDAVSTPLAAKGTGVRGGVLVAMLSYLAVNATRSMVFALEEPEAFLHPAAQEDLRDRLEQVSEASGITLLVTTHSPFVMSRSPRGRIFCMAKDSDGRTRLGQIANGADDHAPLMGDLVRETTLEDVLAASTVLPSDAYGVILVEGDGDRFCLELAARLVGRPDLLDGLVIRPTQGTIGMITQAVITKAATDLPVVALVDNDDPGRKVRDTLVGNTFGFAKKEIVSYASLFEGEKWRQFPVEAEDLFDPALIKRFVSERGSAIIDGSNRRPDEHFHYDFGQTAKRELEAFLDAEARPDDVALWIELIVRLRALVGLGTDESAAEIVVAAPRHHDDDPLFTSDGDTLIVTGQHDLAFYTARHALLLPTDRQLPSTVTHVGFYANAAIQPSVPSIVADHPHLLFSDATVRQLRTTGKPSDDTVAELIEGCLRTDTDFEGATYRVLMLSPPDNERTLHLDTEVKNTKTMKGRPIAWTVRDAIVSVASLMAGPATTDDLDEIEARRHEE